MNLASTFSLMRYAITLFLALVISSPTWSDDVRDLSNTAIDTALDDPTALYNLGVEFYAGRVVKQSRENAAVLWRKAAALGSVGAKNNLGYLLFHGLGVSKDQVAAVELWRQAAEAGHSESQVHFGGAVFNGEGTDPDRVTGLAWVIFATQSSKTQPLEPDAGGGAEVLSDAEAELARLLLLATPEEVAAARAAVSFLPITTKEPRGAPQFR